jgi:hypothetical protein
MANEALSIDRQNHTPPVNLGDYSCIEFRIQSMGTIYLSRLWQTTDGETCFLIKEGSAVLDHLQVGDEIDARFLTGQSGSTPHTMTTRIHGIRCETSGRFKGHHLIALVPGDPNTTTH